MDGVLERIEEDDDQEASEEDEVNGRGKKSSAKKTDEEGKGSTGKIPPEKGNSEPFDLGAASPQQQPVQAVDLGTEEDDGEETKTKSEKKKAALRAATSGSLELHIIEATLERNLDTFGNQDPFAILEIGDQKFQTKTIDGGGKKPKWNEQTTFNVQNTADEMSLTVFDEDQFSNELNCAGKIPLAALCVVDGSDQWFDL